MYPPRQTGLNARRRVLRGVVPQTTCLMAMCLYGMFGMSRESPAAATDAAFVVQIADGAIVSLRPGRDATDTEFIARDARLGDVFIRFRIADGAWQVADTAALRDARKVVTGEPDYTSLAIYESAEPDGSEPRLRIESGFRVAEEEIRWDINVRNLADQPLEIGDFAVSLPVNRGGRGGRGDGDEAGPRLPVILKHSFLSGHGSFLFWMRADSAGPYLTMVPVGDTHIEYWEGGRGAYSVFVHSAAAGAEARERGTNWRQPHTRLALAPQGQPGDAKTHTFKLRMADGYDAVRQILVDEGGIDTHVVPGMTVPSDLIARIALRTTQPIHSVEAEFPETTEIIPRGANGEYTIYQVRFEKLGENRLQVNYGDGRHMYLEFFSTEPMETLIRKRGAFIAGHQVRDPAKWYDGLLCDWNMQDEVQPTPDNYDRIAGFRIYAVTCDDPGLSKPAFLAAKLAEFPVQGEVEALDYYIAHFVWGGLQQTTEEPHPYGVYGIPDWKQNRDSDDPGRNGRRHLWRVYDYPHVIQLYFGMYRVAKNHPQIKTELAAEEYLRRAFGTARAMFTVPMEIEGWSAYGTGFYNELVIVDLIAALEAAGMADEAGALRGFWERKVKAFVNRDLDLFRSEYAFDSTGFESTHALAKWALAHADPPGEARSGIPLEDARTFMEKQMAANLFCRGWIEPAYYYLGSDYRGGAGNAYVLTYMSQMGGWSVLDYGLHVAARPAPYLRLGYASYLSAWALMNTGTPASDYGYWYPGRENDGGAGGGFEPAPFGRTWLGQPHTRGSWYYACEIDLGYCGALRTAATILADDPIFGRFCFGGDWQASADGHRIIPRDGLRRRFHARLKEGALSMVLDSDRFAAGQPILLTEDLASVRFVVESDNPARHTTRLHLAKLAPGAYRMESDSATASAFRAHADGSADVSLMMGAGGPETFRLVRDDGNDR
jgi:hypothetical protein